MDPKTTKITGAGSSELGVLLFESYDRLQNWIATKIPRQYASVIAAEDVVQEALAAAYRSFDGFVPTSERSFSAWLEKIAENCLLSAIRAARRKKRGGEFRRIPNVRPSESSSAADLLQLLEGDEPTPSKQLRQEERVQTLRIHVAALPDDYRQAIQLWHLEGRPLDEVSALMDRTPDQLRGILFRARKKLRELLGQSSFYLSRD